MSGLRIGTRGSALAMWQANWVRDALEKAHPDLHVTVHVIRTRGDRDQNASLSGMPATGIFTKEIQNALLAGEVDLAVHSLKDLPTEPVDGLALAAVTAREDPADALIARDADSLAALPTGGAVMTGSVRRWAQLLHRRRDLVVRAVRGNVPTRVKKFRDSDAAAILLARAGLVRLGMASAITARLDPADFLPACGQGALGLEARADDATVAELCRALDHFESRAATAAERSFLAALGGGCRVPIGAYARFTSDEGRLTVTGMVANLDGSRLVSRTVSARVEGEGAAALGAQLADAVCAEGGRDILAEVVNSSLAAGEEGR